jgi:hypothetical protein
VKFLFSKFLLFIVLVQFVAIPQARAVSFGDAALTVSIATVSGAILGVSTLPFYDTPSDHSKNIFYGAAIGAVVGVLVSAYAGVEEGKNADDEEEAVLKRLHKNQMFAFHHSSKPDTKHSARIGMQQEVGPAYWTSLAQIRF